MGNLGSGYSEAFGGPRHFPGAPGKQTMERRSRRVSWVSSVAGQSHWWLCPRCHPGQPPWQLLPSPMEPRAEPRARRLPGPVPSPQHPALARGAVGACESLWPGIRLKIRTEDCWWPEVRVAEEWDRRWSVGSALGMGWRPEASWRRGSVQPCPWKTCLLRESWGVKPVPS